MTGSDYERELMALLEVADVTAIRSAGSHGHGDVVGLSKESGTIVHGIDIVGSIIVEAKKRSADVFYPTSDKEQWDAACKNSEHHSFVYGVRWVTGPYSERGWEFFFLSPGMGGDYPPLRRGEGVPPPTVFPRWTENGYRDV